MRFKTVEVEPYTHTYCAYNKHTGETYGDFACLVEATDFVKAQPRRHPQQGAFSYTLKLEADQSSKRFVGRIFDGLDGRYLNGLGRPIYDTDYFPAPDWVIVDDLGNVVSKDEVEQAARRPWRNRNWEARWARYDLKGRRMARIKGSGDKVKLSCEQVLSSWRDGGYDNRVRGYHRGPQTTRERRLNEAHITEYGWDIVRGRRRRLPSNWDDRPISMWKTEDNWKHHSKRQKQWKPK